MTPEIPEVGLLFETRSDYVINQADQRENNATRFKKIKDKIERLTNEKKTISDTIKILLYKVDEINNKTN